MKSIIFEIKEDCNYLIVFKLLVLFHLGKKENINDVQESIATTTSMVGNLVQYQNSLKMLYHSTNQFFHLINKIWEGVHQSIEKNKNKINCLIWKTEYINYFMLINRNSMIGDFMCDFTRKKISLKVAWFYNISTASVPLFVVVKCWQSSLTRSLSSQFMFSCTTCQLT